MSKVKRFKGQNMKKTFPLVMRRIILPALLSIIVYIVLHEFGHVIVLWAVHAEITEFRILKAHVLYEGGDWTDLSDKWMHVNGALFPLILSFIYSLCYNQNCKNGAYRSSSFFFSVCTAISLIPWVINPFLYIGQIETSHAAGMVSSNDDTYKFLYNFSFDYPVWIVSAVAAIVLALGVFIAVKKGIIRNFIETLREMRNSTKSV